MLPLDCAVRALAIYQLALEPFGGLAAAPTVTVVGDSLKNDILPATELGCRTIWLRGEPWNYADADFQTGATTQVINDLKEILLK